VLSGDASKHIEALRRSPCFYFIVFAASTLTSTIPGITAAGPSPEATLYTPTLDVEYLVAGRPLTLDVIPVTPEGIPTPALVTRAALSLVKDARILVVNAGLRYEPRVPVAVLPSRRVGGRIDEGDALPRGTARRLYEEARLLAHMLARAGTALVVGETIPAGTTTALAILEALGYRALGRVSSSMPNNPHGLKEGVVRRALSRLRGSEDVFERIDSVGDPLHVSVAGFVTGALESGASVILAGGTQMVSVLGILARLGVDTGSVAVATTRWLVEDPTSDIAGLLREVSPHTPLIASMLSFGDAPFEGLRAYERGYVKEGVGMGGAVLAALVRGGASLEEVKRRVYDEYSRVTSLGASRG